MLKVSVKIPDASLKAIKRSIEAKLKERLELVALQAYNYIVTHEYPYYSGSYASSWNIQAGTPDKSYNQPLLNRGYYPEPDVKLGFKVNNVYDKVFISNYTPHARMIELSGSPTHPTPWLIAASARDATVLRYRFF